MPKLDPEEIMSFTTSFYFTSKVVSGLTSKLLIRKMGRTQQFTKLFHTY